MENPYEYYGGRSFRSCVDEALRAWDIGKRASNETNANGVHIHTAVAVDYATFKRRLGQYSQRRTKLRRLMDKSESNKLVAEDVMAILRGSNDDKTGRQREGVSPKPSMAGESSPGGCYLPMNDNGDDDETDADADTDAVGAMAHHCDGLSGMWNGRIKMVHRQWALREVSRLEREGMAIFLAGETRTISGMYRSNIRFLDGRFVEWRTRLWYERNRSFLPTPSTITPSMSNNNNSNKGNNGNNSSKSVDSDDSSATTTRSLIEQTLDLGKALLDLEAFCALNSLIVRQTLIRYDEFARSFEGTPLMEFYLKTVLRSTNPHDGTNSAPNLYHHELRQILKHKEVTALCEDFSRHLDWLVLEDDASLNGHESSERRTTWTGMRMVLQTVADRFRSDREELRRLRLSSAADKAIVASNERPAVAAILVSEPTARTIIAERFMDMVGKYVLFQFGWYLDGTLNRGRSLTEDMRLLTKWKRRSQRKWSLSQGGGMLEGWDMTNLGAGVVSFGSAGNNPSDAMYCGAGHAFLHGLECDNMVQCGNQEWNDGLESDHDDVVSKSDDKESFPMTNNDDTDVVTNQQKFNLFMALAGGFLYCMNYYIIEPSSTMYVNALGAHDAAGAALIGMMPIASFLSAIGYSVWTNTVFRQPFLVSCSLMVTGNIIYSSAFNHKSLTMALIGRFLTGLGGPKMIVRRYMADTTSESNRTSVNALFGMVVATGSALGPGCAIMLSNFEFILFLPGGSELWFNSMTGPGWFMATLWAFFSIALFWGFREQDRIGLAEKLEQDEMEQRIEKLRQERENDEACYNRIEKGNPETNATAINSKRIEEGAPEKTVNDTTKGDLNPTSFNGNRSSKHRNAHSVTYDANVKPDETMRTILVTKSSMSLMSECYHDNDIVESAQKSLWVELKNVSNHFHFPVRICMGLLFAKVFVIETLVSCTSVLSKNRYAWTIHQVGLLGFANGFFVIPLSILVGKLSLQYQDRLLMVWLLSVGIAGLCLLVDGTDLLDTGMTPLTYNWNVVWSVGPIRYVVGYFVTYLSIQSFEGIIGSALSKLIPTALAQGTFNSGLLATLVDTFGRSCGDLFISLMGFWDIRQLMNHLFLPGVVILIACLIVVRKYYDLLAV